MASILNTNHGDDFDDDFEVIQAGIDTTYNSLSPSLSIALPPQLIPLPSIVSEEPSLVEKETITAPIETAVLDQSIIGDMVITDVIRSQTETKELLERHIKALETITATAERVNSEQQDRLSMAHELTSLKGERETLVKTINDLESKLSLSIIENGSLGERLANLSSQIGSMVVVEEADKRVVEVEEEVEKLKEELKIKEQARASLEAEKNRLVTELSSLRSPIPSVKSSKSDYSDELQTFVTYCKAKFNETVAPSESNYVKWMYENLEKGIGGKTNSNAHPTALKRSPTFDEMENMRQHIDRQNAEIDRLRTELSEECARRLEESERRALAEHQLTNNGLGDTGDMAMVIRQLRDKNDECERLRQKITDLERQVRCVSEEGATNAAIVNVIQEDNQEATRIIVEKERLLKEKELLIEEQKRQIEQFQEKCTRYGLDHW